MLVSDRSIGAIKVYSRQPAAYHQESEQLLTLFARQAGILLSNAQSYDDAQQLTAQLKTALVSRDLIGQAKGILIARGAADEEAAFAMLVTASQRTNVKVRDVAQRLVTEAGFGHGLSRNPPRPPA
jgi:GAF domain-containing protein